MHIVNMAEGEEAPQLTETPTSSIPEVRPVSSLHFFCEVLSLEVKGHVLAGWFVIPVNGM